MVHITEFPRPRPCSAVPQGHVDTTRHPAQDVPQGVIEIVLALLEQVRRTNAAILAYQSEDEPSVYQPASAKSTIYEQLYRA